MLQMLRAELQHLKVYMLAYLMGVCLVFILFWMLVDIKMYIVITPSVEVSLEKGL